MLMLVPKAKKSRFCAFVNYLAVVKNLSEVKDFVSSPLDDGKYYGSVYGSFFYLLDGVWSKV